MLTYPSGSLPQIVCPMDEDAIPPNPFCSAPPHSEPPPPLFPLSSITPSCSNDGIPEQRRSGRIKAVRAQTLKKQSNTDGASVQKPSRQNPHFTKRQREAEIMVQVSPSKQLRAENTHVHAKENEDGFDCSCTAEHQNVQKNQKSPQKKAKASATENVVEQFAYNTTQNHADSMKSDMDTCTGLDTLLENASAPKGWVIGPLFQSFKSKMASFTEIVMSPVKLFRANNPPLSMDHTQNLSECERPLDFEQLEPSNMFNPAEQSETKILEAETNQQRQCDVGNAQNTDMDKYAKKLFDEELTSYSSEKPSECGITCEETNCRDYVPLQRSPIPCFFTENISESAEPAIGSSVLLQTSVNVGASHETKLKISSAIEDQTAEQAVLLKPLPRKRMGDGSELKKVISKTLTSEFEKEQSDLETSDSRDISKTVPVSSSYCYTQRDTDCLQPDGDENEIKMESCLIQQSLCNNLNSPNERTMKSSTDILHIEYSAAGLGRAKGQKLSYSQAFLKRKQSTVNICTHDATKQELINVASQSGLFKGSPNRQAMLTDTVEDTQETLKSARKRKDLSIRTNGKGNCGQEMLSKLNEARLKTKNECSPDAMLVCHFDKSSEVLENGKRVCSSSKMKPSASYKRLKTVVGFVKPDVSIDDGMDLETTMAISSTKQVEEELLSEVFIHPDIKQLQRKCRNTNKKTLKRKTPVQTSSLTESDSILDSASSGQSGELSELMSTDANISLLLHREENIKTGLNRLSKRPKKGLRDTLKSYELNAAQEKKQCIKNISVLTKRGQTGEGKSKITDPVYFEITPFKDSHQPASSCSQPLLSCSVLLNDDLNYVLDKKQSNPGSLVAEVFSTDVCASGLNSSSRKVNSKPRRADKQRRKCRGLHSITCEGKEVPISVTMDDVATASTHQSENGLSRRLLRSRSCPEIPSFHSNDTPWTASLHSPHHSRTPTSQQHQSSHTPHVSHPYKYVQRARRHTVCSIEVEREIAPLCLRKEVYPSRRSAPYEFVTQHLSPTLALSPSTTLSALASCFLSSPLAFLSKKGDRKCSAASSSTSCHVSPSTSSFSKSAFSSSTLHLPGFLHGAGSSHAALDAISSKSSLMCESETQQQCREEEYGEDTSCSSQEYEDVGLREENALSDSEIKVVQKLEERGKVSSIRIRKTLPKPQNNLTPMGLPKPIRLKKKEFSLEEIYTNKNFSKPPEREHQRKDIVTQISCIHSYLVSNCGLGSRLETIFEVPFNRRNGSESWFGPRRVKRFLQFLEVGEVRKPKKQLVGVGKTGLSSSRTRRGAFTKDESPLTVQDVDSLLCAKLDELNLWLIRDQNS